MHDLAMEQTTHLGLGDRLAGALGGGSPTPAAALLDAAGRTSWAAEIRRLGIGLALSAIYGAALGARYGTLAMAVQALGVPLGLLAVAVLGAPAFYILLAHVGHPIDALGLGAAVARATGTAGLVLAGLAPAALLLTMSTEGAIAAGLYGALGLGVGGGLGLRSLRGSLRQQLLAADPGQQRAGRFVILAFVCFAALLAARVWWLAVPSLGGGA
jgi:hypothetical protein